ncbi:hypothetical protein ACFLZN_02555, partial [Nanoarchaeota archaeon]
CYKVQNKTMCDYFFNFELSEESSLKIYDLTKNMEVHDGRVNVTLDLYIDDTLVTVLYLTEEIRDVLLKTTALHSYGEGETEEEAVKDALEQMKKRQIMFSYKALPVPFYIVKHVKY